MSDPVAVPGGPELFPVERMVLTIALAQVREGRDLQEGVAAQCVLTLARLTGRFDWTTDD